MNEVGVLCYRKLFVCWSVCVCVRGRCPILLIGFIHPLFNHRRLRGLYQVGFKERKLTKEVISLTSGVARAVVGMEQ